MRVIHVGPGHRSRAWIDIIARRHPDIRSVAMVSASDALPPSDDGAGHGLGRYATLEEALRHVEADAAILAGPLAFDDGRPAEILEAGLGVILERPPTCSLPVLKRLSGLARDHGRPIVVARTDHDRSDRTLRRLLAKVGTITQVNCRDRRPLGSDGGASDAPYAQLTHVGLDHIESLRELLAAEPLRIAARCGGLPWRQESRGSITEVFLELKNDLRAEYFGSVSSGRAERDVWIEGSRGSLRDDGRVIWWRKRGWPRFVPWRWRAGAAAKSGEQWTAGADEALARMQLALADGPAAEAARTAAMWPIALLGSAMQADQEGTVVAVDDWFRATGARADVDSAAD